MAINGWFHRLRGQATWNNGDVQDTRSPKYPEPTVMSVPDTDSPASPTSAASTASTVVDTPTDNEKAMTLEKLPQEFGRLGSWRGAFILLVTSGSQFLDNVFMTSSNMALASIQEEFDVSTTNLQWMISAYTLTFGGFLLLAGALSDR